MRAFAVGTLSGALALGTALVACSSDDDPPHHSAAGGTAGSVAGASGDGGGAGSAGASGAGPSDASSEDAPIERDAVSFADQDASSIAPQHLPFYPDVVSPPENAYSPEKALLGKILFWEEQLSSDDTVACGTCHRPAAGGSDPRAASSDSRHPGADRTLGTPDDPHGAQGIRRCEIVAGQVRRKLDATFADRVQVTRRKPPTYLDAMFALDLFWDGRAKTKFTVPDTGEVAIQSGGGLESQVVGPPLSDVEMACEGRSWAELLAKLGAAQPLKLAKALPAELQAAITAHPTYPALFQWAFGSSELTTKRIAFAIATHERRLLSNQTPWDKFNAGDTGALSLAEQRGLALFINKAQCATCHAPPFFTDGAFHNLGFIDSDFDTGLAALTNSALDKGKVKTPSLRNVALREAGGLLHYGFGPGATLEELLKAYNEPPMKENTDLAIKPLGLSAEELSDVVAFMRGGLTDPRVQAEIAPFDRPRLSSEP